MSIRDEYENGKNMLGAKCDLKDRFVKRFLTLKGEHVIYSTRQHWSVLIPTFSLLIGIVLLSIMLIPFSVVISSTFSQVFFLIGLIIITMGLGLFVKQIVEWFFHFYIITNRKIIEVTYRPFLSRIMNDVLLDQVRCTEVDVQTHGIVNEFLNVGDVLITFDRPTHEQIFTVKQVKDPRTVAMHLADSFGTQSFEPHSGIGSARTKPAQGLTYSPGSP